MSTNPVTAIGNNNDSDTGHTTLFDPSTRVRRGLCPVTGIRHQTGPLESHSLYYEQHGTGPEKVVFIMGLNSTSFAWSGQVDHFGRSPDYSVLVFDNRGVGHSGVPRGPYTTSGMAQDVVVLLDFIGWTDKRAIHIVGISLGGMIAQELAMLIPDRVVSLTLVVTTPGGRPWSNLPSWKGITSLTRTTFIKDPYQRVPIALDMLFPQKWLNSKALDDPAGRTNREIQTESYNSRIAVTRPQQFLGAISQMSAGLTHNVSPARLRTISASIPKVLILTGDEDNLVDPRNSLYMKEHMPEAELIQWKETGHGIHAQQKQNFNDAVTRAFQEGRERVEKEEKWRVIAQ
ncbi:hypothetical protein JAAARDRAFT_31569 [Jaapia argillacea MUCL 33604]|uniref:AB hydrolase-1 domain-containing protein n=1 Tax=Jaapia argillacea MUCL 33604 TaxID=933084 RepID=A0A067Q362_9AGAM|nr:hypothetical protein JAAARDRAFT_31569 [Jaapia argillacea MUCL 33604]